MYEIHGVVVGRRGDAEVLAHSDHFILLYIQLPAFRTLLQLAWVTVGLACHIIPDNGEQSACCRDNTASLSKQCPEARPSLVATVARCGCSQSSKCRARS